MRRNRARFTEEPSKEGFGVTLSVLKIPTAMIAITEASRQVPGQQFVAGAGIRCSVPRPLPISTQDFIDDALS